MPLRKLRLQEVPQAATRASFDRDIYSQLSSQDKAVDLIYVQHGQHILQAPLDRYASQQGNVDWHLFWLTGAEAPAYAHSRDKMDLGSQSPPI